MADRQVLGRAVVEIVAEFTELRRGLDAARLEVASAMRSMGASVRDFGDGAALTLGRLSGLLRAGAGDEALFAATIASGFGALSGEQSAIIDRQGAMTNAFLASGRAIGSLFAGAAVSGRGLERVLANLGEELERLILRALIFRPLEEAITGGTGGLFSGIFGGLGLPGFAGGGSFEVGGSGGIDSQLIAFRATPGERVAVSNSERGDGSSALVNVEVINNTGARTRQEERTNDQGGKDIRVFIGEQVAQDFLSGGPAFRALRQISGLGIRPVQR